VSDATYRVIELTGTSSVGVTEAMQNGVARANKTLRNLDWVEVAGIRGHIADGRIAHFQVSIKVGFRMDDPD
jgi:flavin-binding protein dodecin